mgnify:CR=1 FL=1
MALALTARERRVARAARHRRDRRVRLVTLGAYPLMDSTESRYAEIARKMLETGDWLMPQFDYGVPFWASRRCRPWLSAMRDGRVRRQRVRRAVAVARCMLAGCGALVHALASQRGGRDQALWTLALFVTTAMVFVAAGAVMTDPALMLGTTLSMAGFWIAVNGPERYRRIAGVRVLRRALRRSAGEGAGRASCSTLRADRRVDALDPIAGERVAAPAVDQRIAA